MQYLNVLKPLIQASQKQTIVLGDYNQRISMLNYLKHLNKTLLSLLQESLQR